MIAINDAKILSNQEMQDELNKKKTIEKGQKNVANTN